MLEGKDAKDFAVHLEWVYVLTGPVFDDDVKKLARGVDVPSAFYSIILDEENGQTSALAFSASLPLARKTRSRQSQALSEKFLSKREILVQKEKAGSF